LAGRDIAEPSSVAERYLNFIETIPAPADAEQLGKVVANANLFRTMNGLFGVGLSIGIGDK
jgi:hypothetical protein